MDFLQKNKGALAGGIILILALFLYNMLGIGSSSSAAAAPAADVGADLLKLADTISKATLSQALFSTSGYKILTDWSTPLQPEPLGRPNPFAPLGK